MSEEKPETVKETKATKKQRDKRRQSTFIVLKQQYENGEVKSAEPVPEKYVQVAGAPTLKACIKAIEDGKITGKLLIVCVRRRLLSEVQETLKLT